MARKDRRGGGEDIPRSKLRFLRGVGLVQVREKPEAAPFAGLPLAPLPKPGRDITGHAARSFAQPTAIPFAGHPVSNTGKAKTYLLVPIDPAHKPRETLTPYSDADSLPVDRALQNAFDKARKPVAFAGTLESLKKEARGWVNSNDCLTVANVIAFVCLRQEMDDELRALREQAISILASIGITIDLSRTIGARFTREGFLAFREEFSEQIPPYEEARLALSKALVTHRPEPVQEEVSELQAPAPAMSPAEEKLSAYFGQIASQLEEQGKYAERIELNYLQAVLDSMAEKDSTLIRDEFIILAETFGRVANPDLNENAIIALLGDAGLEEQDVPTSLEGYKNVAHDALTSAFIAIDEVFEEKRQIFLWEGAEGSDNHAEALNNIQERQFHRIKALKLLKALEL